jgi:predicted GNAT superfamily acetyltransferase
VAEESIRIERLRETEDFYACVEVQKQVWGMPDILVVPTHLLITAQKNGGLVLGAFNEEGRMVGYLFGFLGTREPTSEHQHAAGRLKHCSHMMGVLPEYQAKGVGYLLKLGQRDHALSQGLDLVTWTYDPLESMNANLNLCKLGVVSNTYVRDIYGQMTDDLNIGLATDRFQVEWWVASKRVAERIEKGGEKPTLDEVLGEGAKPVNVTTVGADGLLRPSVCDLAVSVKDVLVEVPADFQSIKATDKSVAIEWRMHTREVFERYFAAGYVAAEFISQVSDGSRHSYYVLKQGFVVS